MEKFFQNRRESHISKIVGVDQEAEKDLLEFFKEEFESDKKSKFEKKHPKELDELIPNINNYLKSFLEEYGVETIELPAKNIHIIDREKLTPEIIKQLNLEKTAGRFLQENGHILMNLEYEEGNKLPFLQTMIHEMIHLNSYHSFQKARENEKEWSMCLVDSLADEKDKDLFIRPRRSGLSIYSEDGSMIFKDLDEALITELTIRFDNKYFSQIPEISEEYEKRQKAIEKRIQETGENPEKFRDIAFIKSGEKNGSYYFEVERYSYEEERKKLYDLINDLYEKNRSDYSSKEEIFALFVEAAMKGNLLPLGRLLKKTYGKEYFLKIREEYKKDKKDYPQEENKTE